MRFFFVGIEASNLLAVCLYCKRFATACPELGSGKSPTRKNAPWVNLLFFNIFTIVYKSTESQRIKCKINKFMN